MSEELKPCPFCGRKAKIETSGSPAHDYCVVCTWCLVKTPRSWDRDRAVRAWNTRAEKVCRWGPEKTHDFCYEGHDYWQTECGDAFVLTADGLPAENGYLYCPNCGGKVEVEE